MTFDSVEPREPVELSGAQGPTSSHGEHGDLRARASRRLELICAGEPAPPNDPRGQDAADTLFLSQSLVICEEFGLSRQTAGLAASYLAHAKARKPEVAGSVPIVLGTVLLASKMLETKSPSVSELGSLYLEHEGGHGGDEAAHVDVEAIKSAEWDMLQLLSPSIRLQPCYHTPHPALGEIPVFLGHTDEQQFLHFLVQPAQVLVDASYLENELCANVHRRFPSLMVASAAVLATCTLLGHPKLVKKCYLPALAAVCQAPESRLEECLRCLRSMATSFETELAEICQVSPPSLEQCLSTERPLWEKEPGWRGWLTAQIQAFNEDDGTLYNTEQLLTVASALRTGRDYLSEHQRASARAPAEQRAPAEPACTGEAFYESEDCCEAESAAEGSESTTWDESDAYSDSEGLASLLDGAEELEKELFSAEDDEKEDMEEDDMEDNDGMEEEEDGLLACPSEESFGESDDGDDEGEGEGGGSSLDVAGEGIPGHLLLDRAAV